jgi:hypothetical protein
MEEKVQYGWAADQPFTDSMAAYYSVIDKVLYDNPRLIYP